MLFLLIPVILFSIVCKALSIYKKNQKSLEGKHVCITGGSSGIGKAAAILSIQRGANVTIIARNKERLEAAVEEIKKHKINDDQKVQYLSIDCSDEKVIAKLSTLDETDPIYMFINCAGMAICGRFEDFSVDNIHTLINVNLISAMFSIKAIIPGMKKRREGIIVLTGSQGSLFGIYGLSVYSCTKFALRGLAESIHMELKDYGVSVTLALPPDTDTPGFANENKDKPKETQLISESAGLFDPNKVAEALLNDSLKGKFFSVIGFESWMLTTFCVGMSPFSSWLEVIYQSMFLGLFRFVSSFYLKSFQNIVSKCYREEVDRIKKE